MAKKICPNCGSRSFEVTAHVTQDWVVDENGSFIKSLNECLEVTHFPDDEDIWDCHNCGYSAAGAEFDEDKVASQLTAELEWKDDGSAEVHLHHGRKIRFIKLAGKRYNATLIEMGSVELVEREGVNLQQLLLRLLEENGTVR